MQRLIVIKICQSYRTISFEAAVTITGLTPIDLKIKEVIKTNIKSKLCETVDGLVCDSMERKVSFLQRAHPGDIISINIISNDRESELNCLYRFH